MSKSIDEAAGMLRTQLYDDKNIQAVGHDMASLIYIYTIKTVKGYPKDFEGYKVKVVKVGRVRPCDS